MVLSQGSSLKKSTLTESDSEDEDDIVERAIKITTFREAIDLGNEISHRKGRIKNYLRVCQKLPNFSTLSRYR